LLYRFRAIDRLPEPSSTAQVRGSVVHAALEQLYALPAADRGPETAMTLVEPAWERVATERPRIRPPSSHRRLRAELLDEARTLLSGYYRLEDPRRFDPQSCEQRVEVELSDGTLLRGFVDRYRRGAHRRDARRRLQDGQGAVGGARLAEAKACSR